MARAWIIGRGEDCDVIVDDAVVSSRHCRLSETEHGYVLEDLQSSNGTYVNGVRLRAPTRVTSRDRVTLGQTKVMPWPVAPSAVPRQAAPADLSGKVIRVGRAPDNDVVLDYPGVSAHHARISVGGGQAWIEDLGSTNGTAVGRPERKVKRAAIAAGDTAYFGSLHVAAARLLEGKLRTGAQPHVAVAFGGQSMVFGRDPGCDQVLSYPMISARHARLSRTRAGLVLEDLGSTNGTFVNGRRVQRTEVRPGDVIGLGSYSFTLTDEGELQRRDYRGNVTLEALNVTVDVPRRRLLQDVSLTIFPSEFVGLMGPSGAGKTTLMNALNGYTRPTGGQVFLNGESLYANYARFAAHIGYVPQDDIMHRDLTVAQALYYTARLRLPRDFSDADIGERVADVIRQLGLEGTENVLIGSPEKKGISGGQRKRVNLAMELLTDPLILFLDEPTSGLSSEDAVMVMRLLRSLADAGKTILLTIHQPSLEAYRLMDNLVMVSRDANSAEAGRLVYYGPAYPDAVEFFRTADEADAPDGRGDGAALPPSPDAILRGLKGRTTDEWTRRYEDSRYCEEYVKKRSGKQPSTQEIGPPPPRPLFDFAQWWTLLRRSLAIRAKDRWNTAILLAQAPVIGLFIGLVYGQQMRERPITDTDVQLYPGAVASAIFLMTLSCVWFGCSNGVREIIGEWAIYRRERMVNASIPAYVVSKFVLLSGQCLIQSAILLGIVHGLCDLKGSWPLMYGLLALVSLVGVALGLTISAASRTSEVAVALVPLVLLPMNIFGGAMQRIDKMPTSCHAICAVMPSRWAFNGLFVIESNARKKDWPPPAQPNGPPRPPDDLAEGWFPKKDTRYDPALCAGVLAGMLILLLAGIHGILRARDIH